VGQQAGELLHGWLSFASYVQAPLDETETLIAWSEVLRAGGASDQAREALMKARALMERKGAAAVVRRIDVLLSEL